MAIYSDSSHTWAHSPLILSILPNQCHPVLMTCSHAAYFFRLPHPVSSSQLDLVLLTCLTKNVFKIFHCEDWCKEFTDLCYSGFSICEYPFYILVIKWSYEFLYCIPAFELLRELCKACFNSSVALLFFCLHLTCHVLWVLCSLIWVIFPCCKLKTFPFHSLLTVSIELCTVFAGRLYYFFCMKMHAGGFRHADSILRMTLPFRGPTLSTFSCCILTEWCVTPPHTQSCSLTHWPCAEQHTRS